MAKEALPNHETIFYEDADFKISAFKKSSSGYGKNFHEELEIKYYYEGSAATMIDNEVYSVGAGDVVVVNPYEIHTNVNIDSGNAGYYLIMLDLDLLLKSAPFGLDLRSCLLSEGKRITNLIRESGELSGLIVRIYDELTGKRENYRLMVYSLASELLTLLLRDHLASERGARGASLSGKTAELIAPALSKIFKDYKNPISVDELAALCGVSKYHFCRVFKSKMGLTVVEYINSYRLSVAEILLKNEGLSTEEVALSCGFNDASYFYRCYKKIKQKPLKRSDFKDL